MKQRWLIHAKCGVRFPQNSYAIEDLFAPHVSLGLTKRSNVDNKLLGCQMSKLI